MTRYYRKVIQITAEDSPNVRLGLAQKANGQVASNEILIPGVLPYDEYVKRRTLWNEMRQTIGLDARFWEGADTLLYPPQWIAACTRMYEKLQNEAKNFKAGSHRQALGIGVDPGEGGANTSITVVDGLGVLDILGKKTPDTSDIIGLVINHFLKWDVVPQNVVIDAGGGGRQLASYIRKEGYDVRTVAFGSAPTSEIKRGRNTLDARRDLKEDRYAFLNLRAEMFWRLRERMDPSLNVSVFALPREYLNSGDLLEQMSPIPIRYNKEGRFIVPPKHRNNPDSTEETLTEIIGYSPDELDSLVLAVYAMMHPYKPTRAGGINNTYFDARYRT